MTVRVEKRRDVQLGIAIEVVMHRERLTQDAAAAALFDIAEQVGVELDDLVELIARAARDRDRP